MTIPLNAQPNGLIWVGGVPYTYRACTPDETSNCGVYLLCRYRSGEPVETVTADMRKAVSEDVQLQAWRRRVAADAEAAK